MITRLLRAFAGREEPAPPDVALPPGVTILRGRWIPAVGGRLSGMRRAAAATTLGRLIIVHPAAPVTERLLRHELAHVRQWQREPLVFPLRYLWNHMRYGYRDNPFELEAREAEVGPRTRGGGHAHHGR